MDFDGSRPTTGIESDYPLWFGFGYLGEKGMFRLGDRFTSTDTADPAEPRSHAFNLLASDHDLYDTNTQQVLTNHPDNAAITYPTAWQDRNAASAPPALAPAGLDLTFARWQSDQGKRRGLLDNNYACDDGSVTRLTAVDLQDPRTVQAPSHRDPTLLAEWKHYLPKP